MKKINVKMNKLGKSILLMSLLFLFNINFLFSQSWKIYPYHQQGSLIYFPQDEGCHQAEPTEWWYTTAHLTGDSTGNEYTYMLTYFYYPYYGFDGFRIFNLAIESNNIFYDETLPCNYFVLSQDSLNIQAQPLYSTQEEWVNLTDSSGIALPFQYHIFATQQHGFIDVEYDAYKPPLMIADSGFLYQGAGGYTYYYSQTGLYVNGTISIDGITETISGIAWVDHQYGEFNPSSGEHYEWFSIQLSNGMDLNVSNIFDTNNGIPDTSTYKICCIYYNDTTSTTVSDFTLERLEYAYMSDSLRCYSQKWHLIWNNIDLIISTLNSDNEVQLPFRFYEGSTEITGTVSGQNVTGVGFAELLHSYEKPQIQFISPDTCSVWNCSQPIIWTTINPDEGNPLNYALFYSIDGCASFNQISDNITDTIYYWDCSGLQDSLYCVFKITGYSIDSTITGSSLSDSVLLIITGIKNYVNDKFVRVYPNPATEKINIVSPTQIKNVTIFNYAGQSVYKSNVNNNNALINTNNFESGVYIIRIETINGIETHKVIIKK